MKKLTPRLPPSRRDVLALPLALSAAALLPPAARAAVLERDTATLKRIEDYLNGIHTLQSRFEQVSDQGGIATGTIYLSRPGKMRVVYDPPVPILMVATDGRIWYYDKSLQQISFFELKDTPAWFLLQDHVSFGGDITVDNLRRDPGVLRVTVTETKNPSLGTATLVLSENPLELRQWRIIDAQQKAVSVTLDDPRFGVKLDPSLFYWTDPRPPNARMGGTE